ncbi:restriction endonuclease subunit S [Clostridium novyi]|uniref:restriction endonuclease subunit S n=1 Tax=Clostridium novyi TaxID=1542 RepID=UPI000EA3F1FB|nr:restriction endonuclease subunit S [Clostridium novyi]AYF55174.1 restriction endonuclease subunit S [Clostridium novyi]
MSFRETQLGRIPIEWNIDTMENSLGCIIDYRGKTPKKSDLGIKTLSAKSVKDGYIDYDSAYHISRKTYDKFMVRGIPQKGDILMTTEAPLGLVAKLDRDDVAIAQRLLTLRGKSNYLENDFLMYYLKSKIGQHQLNIRASGTTVSGIKQSEFRKVLITLPSIEEQKAISKILLDLDYKIKVNNQINKKLEEMAQAIFKQWFVDFEFPNEEGKPYKSSGGEMVESELGMIPKGWEVQQLGNIVNTYNGYSYKGNELSESNDAMVTIKNFDRKGGYKLDGLKEIIISEKVKPHHYVELNDIIVAHTDLTQGAEIIGNPIIIFSKGKYDKLIMSMDTVKVKSISNYIDDSIIYFILKNEKFKKYALGYVNGTTVLHLSKNAIPQYTTAIPRDNSILIKLSKILSNILIKIGYNLKETEKLISLRDTLLPKLMSGEIRVPLE